MKRELEVNQLWQSWTGPANLFGIPMRDANNLRQQSPENVRPENFKLKSPITGWNSWYTFGANINSELIMTQSETANELSLLLDYFILDDGWTKYRGDWLTPDRSRFPKGIPAVIDDLLKNGHQTGLWWSPYFVDPKSDIYKNNPSWIIRDSKKRPINGWHVTPFDHLMGYTYYILDYQIPEVRQYLHTCVDTFADWGVSLLKMDFLYAPYLDPSFKNDVVPHQILTDLFGYIKEKHPRIYTLASGCPHKPARYKVDAIRVSKDITIPHLYALPIIKNLVHENRLKLLADNWYRLNQEKDLPYHLDPDAYVSASRTGIKRSQEKLIELMKQSALLILGDDLTKISTDELNAVRSLVDHHHQKADSLFSSH